MTISQEFETSVLCAPVASIDRRALSQAWYSALYPAQQQVRAQAKPHSGAPPRTASQHAAPAIPGAPSPVRGYSGAVMQASKRDPSGGAPLERRAPRSPLARKITRVFAAPKPPVRSAAFTVGSGRRRVQVLLHRRGGTVRLVAICSGAARERVATALAQARYALASRGIALDAQTRERGTC